MKIIYPFCNNGIGGAEIYAIYLAKEAVKNGHGVKFVLSKKGDLSDRLKQEGLEFDLIQMESSFNPIQVLKSILELKEYFSTEKADMVHAQMLREQSLALGAKFLGAKIKLIRTFHRLDQFNWKMWPLIWLYNWQTDSVVAITEFIQKHLNENGIKRKVALIYNGVPAVDVNTHDKAIGYMGRISKEKGILQFVKENLEAFKEDKLIIGGEGEERIALEKFLKKNKVKNIEYVGRVDNHKDYYSKISVYVLPSESEVLPLNILESFSCGVPVVTFELESLAGIVTAENGIMVRKNDYKGLAKKAIQLLHDSNSLNKKANAAKRDYKEKFSIDLMWSKTEALYKSLIQK